MRYWKNLDEGELAYIAHKPRLRGRRKMPHKYLDITVTFDTETTSIIVDGEKRGYCYAWALCINELVIYGRDLGEFKEFSEILIKELNVSEKRRLVIYVHNLSFDFQFFRKYFDFEEVFARTERKPMYVCTAEGLEFRCSFLLTMLPLAKLPEQLQNPKYHKSIGDLDYTLLRHDATPLTDSEKGYLANDVLVLWEYIESERDTNKGIHNIPLTKTGYVRRYCRDKLKADRKRWAKYKHEIRQCAPDGNLFKMLNNAYAGGYTHANMTYVDLTLSDLKSIDFTSSYPTRMVLDKYPWKFFKREIKSMDDFETLVHDDKYSMVFEIMFENIEYTEGITTISTSKCNVLQGLRADNGRVIRADTLKTTITNIDYQIIESFYDWDYMTIGECYISRNKPLPEEIIIAILDFFEGKTTLKGIEVKEKEYMVKKGMLNGIYGMMVTSPVADTITYNNGVWGSVTPDYNIALEENADRENTFLLYQWGVWVTAYARAELLKGVKACPECVVYCDTDSIKYIPNNKMNKYVSEYNKNVINQVEELYKKYNREIPLTPKGEKAYLGIFDHDGDYKRFKTLGAKRYMTESYKGKITVTISGVAKKAGSAYMSSFDEPFKKFANGLIFPPENTGKKTHSYIDEEHEFYITDYFGKKKKVYAPSAVYLGECEYKLTLINDFVTEFTEVQRNQLGMIINAPKREELRISISDFIRGKINDRKEK